MATANPFDLLGDNDHDDPSLLAASQQVKVSPKKASPPTQAGGQQKQTQGRLPTKAPPPAQAVREARNESSTRGGRGFGRGVGRGRGAGLARGFNNSENTLNGVTGGYSAVEDGDVAKPAGRGLYSDRPRGSFRGRRGGGEIGIGERLPRRPFERHSGTGRGTELKRDGAGRGNWGTPTDEFTPEAEFVNATDKGESLDIRTEETTVAGDKEKAANGEEREEKEMTLEEYEKVLEEKRKALQTVKIQERKVIVDREFETMQQLSKKRDDDDVFIKLGSERDRRKDNTDRDEKTKKSVNINEFLKPKEGSSYGGSRGRGRGGFRGGYTGGILVDTEAPSIEDPGQFPLLGAK